MNYKMMKGIKKGKCAIYAGEEIIQRCINCTLIYTKVS